MGMVYDLVLDHPLQSLALALADHAHDDGSHVFPSVEYLSWKTGYSERQVQRILRELEEARLLVLEKPATGGRGHTNEYSLHLSNGVKKSPFIPRSKRVKGDKMTPQEKGDNLTKGDIDGIKGDKSGVKGDIAMAPEPSNHPINHQEVEEEQAPPISESALAIFGDVVEGELVTDIEQVKNVEQLPAAYRCPKTIRPDWWLTLLKVCKVELELAPTKQQNIALREVARRFSESKITPDYLLEFERRWPTFWKGKDGSPPSPRDIQNNWSQVMRKNENGNISNQGAGGVQRLAQIQQERRERQRSQEPSN